MFFEKKKDGGRAVKEGVFKRRKTAAGRSNKVFWKEKRPQQGGHRKRFGKQKVRGRARGRVVVPKGILCADGGRSR